MKEQVKVGDIVLSIQGHDKGSYFVVTKIEGNKAFIVDGKKRKFSSIKCKNIKHLKLVDVMVSKDIINRIQKGQPVGNKRVYKAINFQTKKIQED